MVIEFASRWSLTVSAQECGAAGACARSCELRAQHGVQHGATSQQGLWREFSVFPPNAVLLELERRLQTEREERIE